MRTQTAFAILVLVGIVTACGAMQPVNTAQAQPTQPVNQIITVEVTRIVEKTILVTPTVSPTPKKIVTQSISMSVPRMMHTATLLEDGNVLIVGGSRAPDEFLADVELYYPASRTLVPAPPLHTPRHEHTASLLHDGRVLVVGGYNLPQQWLSDAEVYDPAKDMWTVIPPLYTHGVNHTATVMDDGRVLVVGGCIGSGICTNRAEIFDPQTNAWTVAAPLAVDRASHTAQLLQDGRVLIIGGASVSGTPGDGDALLYDPLTNSWNATGLMLRPRHSAQSARLLDGRVLVAGGVGLGDPTNQDMVLEAEIYDPATNAWSLAASICQERYGHAMFTLSNGKVLIVGGAHRPETTGTLFSYANAIELYDPATDTWQGIGKLTRPRNWAAAVLLPDGRIWLTGGRSNASFWADTWMISLP